MPHQFVSHENATPGPNPWMKVCSCGYEMPWISYLQTPKGCITEGRLGVPIEALLNKLVGFSNHLGMLVEN